MKNEKRSNLIWLIPLLIIAAICVIPVSEEAESQTKQSKPKVLTKTEKIENQLSIWDGSHIELKRLIKLSMNDPKSFEHVQTRYWEYDTYIIVSTQFRGRNAFGGMVVDYVKAKYSIDGELLEIME
jgi:hypothetical protein